MVSIRDPLNSREGLFGGSRLLQNVFQGMRPPPCVIKPYGSGTTEETLCKIPLHHLPLPPYHKNVEYPMGRPTIKRNCALLTILQLPFFILVLCRVLPPPSVTLLTRKPHKLFMSTNVCGML